MRKILIFLGVLVVIVIAIGAALLLTVPSESTDVRALIAQVPASAEAFVIVPKAAAFDAKLRINPVTRAKMATVRDLPRAWMFGNASLVAWKSGDQIHYLVHADLVRAFLIRSLGSHVFINGTGEPSLDSATVSAIGDLASHLPAGDALVVQRESARGAYPPIGRPAVTAVVITPTDIDLTSVGRASARPAAPPSGAVPHSFPRGAILSAAFTEPPRIIADLNRLFGAKVSALFDRGGTLCVYDVDTRKLLPRPLGVIVLPNDPQRRAIVDSFRQAEAIGIRVRMAEIRDTIALSFDDSIEQYQRDAFDPAPAADQWAARIDAPRLVPILNNLQQNIGLRIAAPRLYRSARDLAGWLGELEQAKTIEAADSVDSQRETLQVRISSK
ncbi:MAG TPA: hypothetical protein VER58_21915 [Thermoanaerobaculia bacterium]|nr:hypothetical protein [Thermoanaerobaculia bacterium]